jgi:hypothetical protein
MNKNKNKLRYAMSFFNLCDNNKLIILMPAIIIEVLAISAKK